MLQPSHHDPQTFTNTGRPPNCVSATRLPVNTSVPAIACLGAAAEPVPVSTSAANVHATTRRLRDQGREDTPED